MAADHVTLVALGEGGDERATVGGPRAHLLLEEVLGVALVVTADLGELHAGGVDGEPVQQSARRAVGGGEVALVVAVSGAVIRGDLVQLVVRVPGAAHMGVGGRQQDVVVGVERAETACQLGDDGHLHRLEDGSEVDADEDDAGTAEDEGVGVEPLVQPVHLLAGGIAEGSGLGDGAGDVMDAGADQVARASAARAVGELVTRVGPAATVAAPAATDCVKARRDSMA